MTAWGEVAKAEGRSSAKLRAGAETLEELQALAVKEAALLTTGSERGRELEVPRDGG